MKLFVLNRSLQQKKPAEYPLPISSVNATGNVYYNAENKAEIFAKAMANKLKAPTQTTKYISTD